ncbi:MAG TPA: 3-hydroxyacyl-CoA dehydrogenase NAD-binding domain-containing protein, partial [Thermomicrobiales bacterium]|nr:3-hydroxyacyl-CoA dehydrogenase NAD-binding domain-containing protein [Thermomicrobiales bacterium]
MTTERVTTIGVVGAGTMGAGIAQVAAQAGFDVILVDQAASWLDRGLETITSGLDRMVTKGTLDNAGRDAILDRIEGSTDLGHLAECDLVIEAVTESFPTKAEVFREVEEVVDPETILATNTSSISISALGAIVTDPTRLVGLHFFNPVPILPLVEVIRGLQTSDETMAIAREVA